MSSTVSVGLICYSSVKDEVEMCVRACVLWADRNVTGRVVLTAVLQRPHLVLTDVVVTYPHVR